MLTLNTNIMSLTTQNYLNITGSTMGVAAERLASGKRIDSSKDDAAGLAISDRMTTQINGSVQASRNSNDAISLAQTTEGALKEVTNNLQRIRMLTVQAANGTYAVTDRRAIQQEVAQRLEAIDTISQQTQFNGIKVLAKNTSMNFQTGANDGDIIAVAMKMLNVNTLGLESYDVSRTIAFTDAADPNTITYTDANGQPVSVAKADVPALTTPFLIDPLSMIDSALVEVTSLRSILGAVQNRFESNIRTQDTGVVNLSAARERIEATDYALETANYTQASILQQAGISVLAQVNAQPKNILPLLQQLG
ncbi:flagellin [Streptomyces lavendulae subsp. lavendulae]|uniref:flagellin N-terminal helical domain-containing protein n=1 Tax=Streptomyces lavendulae TaxID=1914 RepID=UPI0024A38BAA|nr:flagellin [Streptomyces lavendulae]GLV87467.1 flagellin [Streptomyces lavendulae subsp. lavendulae]